MSSEFEGPAPAINAEGLGKLYRVGETRGAYRYRLLGEQLLRAASWRRRKSEDKTFWALKGVSFAVGEGDVVGVIGRNGAGKSTLLKVLSRITPPSAGHVQVRGRVGSLLEVGTGFHPELTGKENIFLAGAVLGMRRSEIIRQLDAIIEFAGVERFVDTPIKRYSTGMYLRLAFGVAAHLETDILLVDEVLAVGDQEFQKKCLGRMADLGSSGRTVLFVSHSMPSLLRLCPRLLLLERGRLVADGPASKVARIYLEAGLSSAGERHWERPSEAPGDGVARLRAVRVRNHMGEVSDEIDIRRPVQVEVDYWHMTSDARVRPSVNLHWFNEDGLCLFVSNDLVNRSWSRSEREPGLVRAVCSVPGNFFAEGRIYVSAFVSTYNPPEIHAQELEAVSFLVVDDRGSGEGVRGDYAGDWPGLVRPMLNWSVDVLSPLDPAGGELAEQPVQTRDSAAP